MYMIKNFSEKSLKTITQEEFDEMVDKHEKWIKGLIFGYNRLLLSNYNLSNLKIKDKNLTYIAFYKCLLSNVVFENCDLKYADIKDSKIINTNFINCNLSYGGFLYDEFLNSDLSTCNIKKSHFNVTPFINTTMPDYPMVCPEKGRFVGYKKVCDINDYSKYYILKLEILEDAKRSSATSNKCRCDKVKVLEIQNLDGRIAENITKAESFYNDKFIYELGKIAEEPKFDECRWNECTAGIHFFMNREEAVYY